MNFFEKLLNSLMTTFEGMALACGAIIPLVLVAIVIVIVGFLIAKLIRRLITKALKAMSFDDLIKKVNMDVMLNKIKPGLSATAIIGNLVYYMILLVFVTAAANFLGLTIVSMAIVAFFAYLPTLIVAILLLIIGLYIADVVKNIVYTAANSIGVSGAKAIANIVYYLLAIMVLITALDQAGVDTSMIRTNIHLILGSILLAFAISYGIASKEIVTNLLSSYYGKGKFKPGMVIRIDGKEGVIEKVDSISVTLRQEGKSLVIPSKNLVEKEVEIINQ